MKSIVYKPLITRGDLADNTTSGLNISSDSSSPTFKYTGYKPQYNWRDISEPTHKSSSESSSESTNPSATSVEEPVSQQIEWEDPSTIDWGTPASTATSSGTAPSSEASSAVTRVQHVFKTPGTDVGEMQEFLDILADNGIAVRITSGARPGSKTAQGKQSWHSLGRALDITPVSGTTREDFNKLREQIVNNPAVIKYMQEHNIGVFDETLDSNLQKTEGSGWHFHIGPDQNAIKGLQAWLNGTDHLAKHGMKFPILARRGTKIPVILKFNIKNDN